MSTNTNIEQIQIMNQPSVQLWSPIIGEETERLLSGLNITDQNRNQLITETEEILSQSGNPNNRTNSEIGLVFGYVQSGKTMSFTALTALAKDNGYRLIIIIAGISTNLVDQSFTRLEKDLGLDERTDMQWLSFKNPKREDTAIRNQIQTALSNWNDPTYPEEDRQTILITVMKQKNHLPNLRELLETIDLNGVPTLIIDDEADQHSMNTLNRQNARTGNNRMSTIHLRIVELRQVIPHHTFIQYTATPQAPLFQDIMDHLSPNFIQLLTPGNGYTGGRTFFIENTQLTRIIDDVDPEENPSMPPQSLLYAMQVFFLGVVKGRRNRDGKNRSMMIHPSQLTFTHSEYERFANQIKRQFIEILSLPNGNPDKQDLIDQFRVAYNDLANTVQDIPPFAEMSGDRLRHAISETVVQSLNSRGNNKTIVAWRNAYSWILIGGQAMDRGFTVEGLTVTYMPRSVGVGNADTIQQRARFFGYKSSYLGYCRVYLDRDAYNRYVSYIEHEEDMRRRLSAHKSSGRELNDWYREVYLSSDLRLSRPSVFSRDFERTILGGEWQTTKIPHNTSTSIESNQRVVREFMARYQSQFSGNPPSINISLEAAYNELLNQLRYTSATDVDDFNSFLYLLENILQENEDERCTIYLMSDFDDPRHRNLRDDNHINQLFQGRSSQYRGDRDVKGNGITFQIHILNLMRGSEMVYRDVVALAAFIPEEIGREVIRWA